MAQTERVIRKVRSVSSTPEQVPEGLAAPLKLTERGPLLPGISYFGWTACLGSHWVPPKAVPGHSRCPDKQHGVDSGWTGPVHHTHPGSCAMSLEHALASLAQPSHGCFGHLHKIDTLALKAGDSGDMIPMPPT